MLLLNLITDGQSVMSALRTVIAFALIAPTLCFSQSISPGLWEISLQLAAEGMPPVQANQCLTVADAADPSKVLSGMSTPSATGCTYSEKSYSSNTFRFAMTCTGTMGIKATGVVSFTPTTMAGQISTTSSLNGQSVSLNSSISARRIGDC